MSKKIKYMEITDLKNTIIQAIKQKDERLQLELLEEYFLRVPMHTVDGIYQNQYAFLMKKLGKVSNSIAISKNVLKMQKAKQSFYAYENIINAYLYLDNYDKAEEYLNIVLSQYENALQYPSFLLCFWEIKRKRNMQVFRKFETGQSSYYQSQIVDYNKTKFYKYTQTYFDKQKKQKKFKEEFTLEKLEEFVNKSIPNSVKSSDSYAVDFYYFNLNSIVGYDEKQQEITGIKVTTLKNTNQLLAIEPVDVINTNKIIVVNKVPYRTEQEQETTKILKKSQIEKFNRRYNRD